MRGACKISSCQKGVTRARAARLTNNTTANRGRRIAWRRSSHWFSRSDCCVTRPPARCGSNTVKTPPPSSRIGDLNGRCRSPGHLCRGIESAQSAGQCCRVSTSLTRARPGGVMTRLSRRHFLQGAAGAAVAAGRPVKAAQQSSWKVGGFTKPLQDLSFEETASVAVDVGWDGVELALRANGHVLPERVDDDLPKLVNALRARGQGDSRAGDRHPRRRRDAGGAGAASGRAVGHQAVSSGTIALSRGCLDLTAVWLSFVHVSATLPR